MDSPEYGMQIFPWWRPEVGSRDFQVVAEAGFSWAKVNFGWREIEGAGKGVFDWSRTDEIVRMAAENDIDLVIRVDHQPAWAGGGFPVNGPPDDYQDLLTFSRPWPPGTEGASAPTRFGTSPTSRGNGADGCPIRASMPNCFASAIRRSRPPIRTRW